MLLLSAIIVGGLFMLRSGTNAGGEQLSVNELGQAKSAFSLDEAATNGWYMGPASEKDMAIFGRNSGNKPADKESTDSHFATIDFRSDGVSYSRWLEDLETRSDPDYTLIVNEKVPMLLQTSSGSLRYELHTYTNQLKPGKTKPHYASNDREAHGYIPYGDGYIRIQGYATPSGLLPGVIEAIKALRLDTEKLPAFDKCTDRDRRIDNCVPAGKCGPTPEIDRTIDCALKDYDKKFNPDI